MPTIITKGGLSAKGFGFTSGGIAPFHGFNNLAQTNTSGVISNTILQKSDGSYISVCDITNNIVYSSSADGVTWNSYATVGTAYSSLAPVYAKVAISPSNVIVAATFSYTGGYLVTTTSSNGGTTWTPLANATSFYYNVQGIACNNSGLFVITGSNSSYVGSTMTSTNGTSWTSPVNFPSYFNPALITCSGNGSFVVIGVNNTGTAYMMYSTSTDGTTWSTPLAVAGNTSTVLTPICIGSSNNNKFILISYNTTNGLYYSAISSDGSNWSSYTNISATSMTIRAVAINNAGVINAVAAISGVANNYYITSTNGTTWGSLTQVPPTSSTIFNITGLKSGKFVLGGTLTGSIPAYSFSN